MLKHAIRANPMLVVFYGLGILAIVALAWALLHVSDQVLKAQTMAQHTGQILVRGSSLRESLAQAESAQRQYLRTGDEQSLQTRDDALQKARQYGAEIRAAMADHPIQRERSQQLARLIDARVSLLRSAPQPGVPTAAAGAGRDASETIPEVTAERIGALIDALAADEIQWLAARQLRERKEHGAMLLGIGLGLIALLLLLLWRLVRLARRRYETETRLRVIDESLPGAVFVVRVTPEGEATYEFLSAHAGKLMGIGREAVLRDARAARALIIQEDRERVNAALAKSATGLTELGVDFRICKPDGAIRWIRSTATPSRRANGDRVWSGYWLDISEIKDTEQALRHAMRRLEDAHSVAGLGDWSCDFATGAMTWSFQIYEMLEREPAMDAPSLEDAVAIFENGAEKTAEAFRKVQETGEPQDYEMTARLPSGNLVTLHVIAVPTVNSAGIVVGMHGTVQDITARKALEDSLYQAKEAADRANRAKSQFLATMSHEIRTPLNGMLGLLELISLMPLQPDLSSALAGVRESGQSLQRIIDDILDFSKVEAGKLEIRPEPTRIGDVIAALRRVHGDITSSRGLELHCSVDPRVSPVVLVDRLRLRQILGNFLSNAIKFTPRGRVELRLLWLGRQGDQERLRYQVQDTGIGVSLEHQQRIFQPFEQVIENFAARTGGTGLGLAICKHLAELMGGQISMSSELGKGTTLTLDLTVTVTDREAVALPLEDDPAPALRPSVQARGLVVESTANVEASVLVVDDHPVNRMLMVKQLHTLGYAAEDVESGAEALQKWKTGRFALIWTDCNMPEMSGYQLSQEIRAAEAARGGPRTPIIACSANVVGAVRQQCLDAGMDDYISKPTDLAVLAEKMRRWLPDATRPANSDSPARNEPAVTESPPLASPTAGAAASASRREPIRSARVIEQFQRVNRADVEQLMQAFAQGDMPNIAHWSHRIKGACGFIGANGLASVCSMIEHAGRTEDASALDWLKETFRSELERLNAELDVA